jgi:hypothetical protein
MSIYNSYNSEEIKEPLNFDAIVDNYYVLDYDSMLDEYETIQELYLEECDYD